MADLQRLAAAISADKVRHDKHCYRFSLNYRGHERPSRAAVARTLRARIGDVDADDSGRNRALARSPAILPPIPE